MSTRSTIAYDDNYHLYDELMDGGVYLEVSNATNASIEIIDGRALVKLRLPKELIEHLKLDDVQLVEPSKMFDEESISNIASKIENNGKK